MPVVPRTALGLALHEPGAEPHHYDITALSTPPIAGWSLWLDASDASTITSSAGAVSMMLDKSPKGFHVTQATAGNRPTTGTRTSPTGLNVLDFDGTTDSLVRSATSQIVNVANGTWTAFGVAMWDTGAGQAMVAQDDLGGDRTATFFRHDGTISQSAAFDTVPNTYTDEGSNVSASTAYVWSSVRGATTIELWINGTSGGSTATSGTTAKGATSDLTVGGTASGTDELWDGWIGEVLVFPYAMASADRATMENYLSEKWIVATPRPLPFIVTFGHEIPQATGEVVVSGPPVAGYIGWYDASNASTITSSGGAVSQWNDQSASVNHVTQATGGSKPTTGTRTLNSLNVLDFDGSADFLSTTTTTGLADAPVTVYVVGNFDVVPGGGSFDNIVSYGAILACNIDGSTGDFGVAFGDRLGTSVAADTSSHVFCFQAGNPNFGISVDGSFTTVSKTLASPSNDQLHIGQWSGSGSFHNGTVGEVVVFPSYHGTTDRQSMEAYLTAKWIASGSATATPAAKQITFTHNTSTTTADANVTPTSKQLTFTHNTPAVTAGASVTPTSKQLTFTHNSPTTSGTGNVIPSPKQLTFSFNTPTTTGDANTTPSAFQLTFTHNQSTASTATDGSATPAAFQLTFTFNTPTLTADANTTPTSKQITFTHNTSVASGGGSATATPAAKQLTFTHNTPTVTGGASVTPTSKQVTFTHNASTATATTDAAATPAAKQVTFTHNQSTATASGDATVTPAAKQVTFNFTAPTVVGQTPGNATPTAKQITFSFPTPTAGVPPPVVPHNVTIPPETDSATITLPAAVTATLVIPTADTATVTLPSTITASVVIPTVDTATITLPAAVTASLVLPTADTATITFPATITASIVLPSPDTATITLSATPDTATVTVVGIDDDTVSLDLELV